MGQLLKQAEQRPGRGGLKKANDANVDPADLDKQRSTSESTSVPAIANASVSDGGNDGGNTGEDDGEKAGAAMTLTKNGTASKSASGKAIGKAGGKASGKAGGRPRRRIGRPPGPERVPTTIRLLRELDSGLTEACEDTGTGPQDVIDAALAEWLIGRGYLDRKSLSMEATSVMARMSR